MNSKKSIKNEGALLRGAPLAIAREKLAERPNDLTPTEWDFIKASTTLQEKEATTKEVQRRRELAQQRALTKEQRQRAEEQTQAAVDLRKRAMWLAVAGGIAVVLAITTIIFGVQSSNNEATAQAERAIAQAASTAAIEQQIEAEQQATIGRSRQLTAQSSSELNKNNYELALVLAIESGRVTDTLEAFSAIRSTLAQPWHSRRVLYGHTEGVTQASWSQDESRILTASSDGTVRVWYTHMTDLIEQAACPRLPRNMTLKEWTSFMEGDYRPTCLEAPIPLDARWAMAEQGGK